MNIAEEALKKIEIHEAECKIRYENIEKRLDEGSVKFQRLERMVIAIYPFILGAIVFAEWMRQ
jgi:hypothetical protein